MDRERIQARIESLEKSIALAQKLGRNQGMIDLMTNTLKLNKRLILIFK